MIVPGKGIAPLFLLPVVFRDAEGIGKINLIGLVLREAKLSKERKKGLVAAMSAVEDDLAETVPANFIEEREKEFHQKFLAAQVADLASLVKLATYKMLYEEPPLPVYCFKNGTSWIVGAFARLDDYEEASLFFYTRIKEEPSTGFIKYSPSNLAETGFSKRTDEHGFYYVKVIKLAEKHPLVEF